MVTTQNTSAEVWADSLDHAWCAPRIPGMFEMEQALGNEINRAVVGQITAKEALDNGVAAWERILRRNGFGTERQPFDYSAVEAGTWAGRGKDSPVPG